MKNYKSDIAADPSGFVVLADYVPHIVQEIRYYSTYNFIGERIDAYRPICAVKHFVLWGIEDQDIRMKPYFYPDLQKQELFEKGYIAKKSSHSRGSTVDLTLLDMSTGKELDMGSPFDLFSVASHTDYKGITEHSTKTV